MSKNTPLPFIEVQIDKKVPLLPDMPRGGTPFKLTLQIGMVKVGMGGICFKAVKWTSQLYPLYLCFEFSRLSPFSKK